MGGLVVPQPIGPIVHATAIRRAALEQLQTWMPSVLAEIAWREGLGDPAAPLDHHRKHPETGLYGLPAVRTWTRPVDPRAVKADETPLVAITSAGVDRVHRIGGRFDDPNEGNHEARWVVAANVIVRADTFDEVADMIGYYTAAARVAILQHGIGLKGAGRPEWRRETYHELDTDDSRSIGGGAVVFLVTVGDVVHDEAGPAVPPAEPVHIDEEGIKVTGTVVGVDQEA